MVLPVESVRTRRPFFRSQSGRGCDREIRYRRSKLTFDFVEATFQCSYTIELEDRHTDAIIEQHLLGLVPCASMLPSNRQMHGAGLKDNKLLNQDLL